MRFGKTLTRLLLTGALLVASLELAAPPAGATSLGATPPSAVATAGAPALSAWRGGIDLYRAGSFTTQQTWLWCTAADIQITRNIVFRQHDHTYAGQQRYFDWMRAHNRYRLPLSAGVDAQGWTEGFQHFVDARYRLYASSSFDAALRSAVRNLRKTSLPVGITVDRGNHAWLLTGFTATADPAVTSHFTITSVRVVGPLYGLQSKNGYDMPPDTKLTPAQLRRFFTPWYYAPTRMVWDGTYVSIQPVAATPRPKPTATPGPKPSATPGPQPTAAPVPTATPTPSAPPAVSASSSLGPSPTPAATPSSGPVAVVVAPSPSAVASALAAPATAAASTVDTGVLLLAALAVAAAGAIGGLWLLAARRR
jgi:hypothetical protein